MMRKTFAVVVAVCMSLPIFSAEDIWKMYLPLPKVEKVTQSKNKVYAVGSGVMFSLDKRDKTIESYSKLTGLSGTNITNIKFGEADNALLVVYDDANIDLLTGKGISNLSELYQKDMNGSKQINGIAFDGKGNAYLSAAFGILKINLKKEEISDTYYIMSGTNNVLDVAFVGDSIYATTDTLVYSALASNKMLANPANWHTFGNVPERSEKITHIVSFGGTIFLLKANGNFYRKNDLSEDWTLFRKKVVSVKDSQGRMNLTFSDNSVESYSSLSVEPEKVAQSYAMSDAVFDASENVFYVAGGTSGIGEIFISDASYAFFQINGPGSDKAYTMKFSSNRLYVITIGTWVDGSNGEQFLPGCVMIYDGFSWKNISASDVGMSFDDLLDIAVDPKDGKRFFVSAHSSGGLFEFRNDEFYTRHTATTTGGVIENWASNSSDGYEAIGGLQFDSNGNLWMLQWYSAKSMTVLYKDETWESFLGVEGMQGICNNVEDENHYRWISSSKNGKIVVYDPATGNSCQWSSFVDQDGKSFISGRFRSIAVDRQDGQQVWLGTEYGPVVVQNAKNIFSSNRIRRIKVPRNDGSGNVDYLLEKEPVNDIVVDAANRKWLATRSLGALLVSADGTEIIKHFTTENSDLLGDNVYSIAINSNTGEVYFCTENGICSYMGDAAEPADAYDDIQVYPNPVREDYNGVITILGLMESSAVRITDVAGNLVYQTVSNGGLATWDGTDQTGRRVPTGVYLAMCYSESTKKSSVAKILIINND